MQPKAWILLKVCPLIPFDIFPKNRPVILKIDVEGTECDALAGMKEFIRENDFVFVALETHRSRLLACPETDWFFRIFRKKGLKPVIIDTRFYEPDVLLPDTKDWRKWPLPRQQFDMAWIPR